MQPLRDALEHPRYVEFHGGPPRYVTDTVHVIEVRGANPGPPAHIESHIRVPRYPKLRAVVFFDVVAGKRVITQVIVGERIIIHDDGATTVVPGTITSAVLQALGKALETVNREVSALAGSYEELGWASAELAQSLGTATRSTRDDSFYAQVAVVYVTAIKSKRRAVEERWVVNQTTAGDWVREARHRSLLTEAPQKGVEGGRLTQKVWLLLGDSVPAELRYELEQRPD